VLILRLVASFFAYGVWIGVLCYRSWVRNSGTSAVKASGFHDPRSSDISFNLNISTQGTSSFPEQYTGFSITLL